MKQMIFSIETTSATFMHGADPRASVEVRPPSIKGIIRYWFRVLAGATLPSDEVRKYENEVFGSASEKVGSKLIVRCLAKTQLPTVPIKPWLLPHKPAPKDPRDKDERSPSPALASTTKLEISLAAFPGIVESEQNKILEVAAASLWTALNLGGFGQRARRGAGSWQLTGIFPPDLNLKLPVGKVNSVEELKNHLEQGLAQVRQIISKNYVPTANKVINLPKLPIAPILAASTASIQLVKLAATKEQDARAELMDDLHGCKNPVFGLPYIKPAAGDATVQGRQASPVHLHLTNLNGVGFVLVQTLMESQHKPNEDRGIDRSKITKYLGEFPDAVKVKL